MEDWALLVVLVGGAFAAAFVLALIRMFGRSIGARMDREGFPFEQRAHQWLQDRATARTLGVDIEVVRFRRKVDFPAHRP